MPDKEIEKEKDPAQLDTTAPAVPDSAPAQAPDQTQPTIPEQSVEQPVQNGMAPPIQQETLPQVPPEQALAISNPQQETMNRKQEDLNLAQDLDSGQIKPETYSDLYAKKSTLGKLGTIFGLLVGGAGSGLTGQPNALLEMMNKEIERDIEAQKQTQHNKQNWYNLSLQHQNTQADVAIKEAQALATNTGTDLKKEEVNFSRWKNTQAGVYKMGADIQAYNSSALGYLHDQQQKVDLMPPGPMKINAQNQLNNVIKPYFMQKIDGNWDKFDQKKKFIDAVSPNPLQKALKDKTAQQQAAAGAKIGADEDVIDRKGFQKAVNLGRFTPEAPGAIRPDQVPVLNNTIVNLTHNRQNYSVARKAIDELSQLRAAGQVPGASIASGMLQNLSNSATSSAVPGVPSGGSLIGNAATGATNELKKYFENERSRVEADLLNRGIPPAELDSYLPRYNDDAQVRKRSIERMNKIFENRDTQFGTPLDQYPGLRKPFSTVPFKEEKSKKETKESNSSSKEPESRWDAFVKKMAQ